MTRLLVVALVLAACGKGSGKAKATPARRDDAAVVAPPVAGSRRVTKIAAGAGVACAVMDNGHVRCWGRNDTGERGGLSGSDDAATPVEVPGITTAVDLVIGGDTGASGDIACAILRDHTATCWGSPQMVPAAPLTDVVSLALGGGTGYVVKTDGTLWGWGSSAFDALADGTTGTGSDTPLAQITGITDVTQVSAGQDDACALRRDGTVTCWGYTNAGRPPTPVRGVTGARAIYAGSQADTTCAVTQDSTLCWSADLSATPLATLAGKTAKVGGYYYFHTCALDRAGAVWCWGEHNEHGQLGHAGASTTPAPVEGLPRPAIDVAVGLGFTCAALDDGSAQCWGYNQRGQLGDGTLRDHPVPAPVASLTADVLPPAKTGLDAVQEGPTPTDWASLPAGCKPGPIAIASEHYAGASFPVKSARAYPRLDGKTLEIDLADHNFHTGFWLAPRGTQATLHLAFARFAVHGALRDLAPVGLGAYKLDALGERVVTPGLVTKSGTQGLFTLGGKGFDAGTVTITHLDDHWACGELALAAGTAKVTGAFAAPIVH